ncbi:type II toxin-antitoxin system ParD family antitoxin [Muricoccus aerilatus]|uniref:type II toxin-antitoxin system ParD family antitoxin n=1 Tax=Muricoccus aerilatus TaxID=452982 RepID=UPI0012ECA9F1|nr:type II toxin-antitoxin system ParD family antitoxin [Roseomonas aerilata]
MITRKSICISLTPEYDRFDAAQLTRGRYQAASRIFRAGLGLLEGQAEPWATKSGARRKQPARPEQGE